MAEKYLVKFSTLIRSILENSKTGQIRLRDEIEIIDKYLELEQMRGNNSFDYKIIDDSDMQDQFIPSMLLQPFVENAVLYGTGKGLEKSEIVIEIRIVERDALQIIVFNNKKISNSDLNKILNSPADHALGITRLRLENYGEMLADTQFGICVIKEYNNRIGTSVIIVLPLLKASL